MGFNGQNCEILVLDGCDGPPHGDPCMNGGTCVSSGNETWCQCAGGFDGYLCQERGTCVCVCASGKVMLALRTYVCLVVSIHHN